MAREEGQKVGIFTLLRRPGPTGRLVLRRWRLADLEDYMGFAGDPQVMLFSGVEPAADLEKGKELFQGSLENKDCFAIVLKQTGKAIGQIKFQKDYQHPRTPSLSIAYELNRAYWGQGYMPEAVNAIIRYAFEVKKVEVLAISHFTVNQRSRRVIEKCGFRHECTRLQAFQRFDGVEFDNEYYAISREEYFQRKKTR